MVDLYKSFKKWLKVSPLNPSLIVSNGITSFGAILPKLTLGINFQYNAKELNMIGSKLFLLFTIVTVVFLVPSMIYLTLQLSFMTSYKDIYQAAKPLFDVGSFYISYLNYLTVFAVISYAFKDYFSK